MTTGTLIVIDAVISSYTKAGRTLRDDDQCFVQSHLRDVRCAGVVLTRSGPHCAPYYVIDYDERTGRTDTVTAGALTAAVRVARWMAPAKVLAPWGRLLESIKEIEQHIGEEHTLDVEFAIGRDDAVHIFQVRPIGTTGTLAADECVRKVAVRLACECKSLCRGGESRHRC